MYGLVLFDDGVDHCTKFSNIKQRINEQCIAKWNSSWFGAKLLCKGSRELCLSMKKSLIFDVPYVEIVKLDSPDFPSCNNEKDFAEINNSEKNFSDVNVSGNDKLETSAHCIDQKACVDGQSEEESKDLEEVDNSGI
ncbi:hypothetical protein JTB14_026854 [Gonioctena quinquepunctata]|nr:hypothetical protein JTB14_026854 [Gonioctena quinquepunctata]